MVASHDLDQGFRKETWWLGVPWGLGLVEECLWASLCHTFVVPGIEEAPKRAGAGIAEVHSGESMGYEKQRS